MSKGLLAEGLIMPSRDHVLALKGAVGLALVAVGLGGEPPSLCPMPLNPAGYIPFQGLKDRTAES